MTDNYSKKAVFGFVVILSVIILTIILALTMPFVLFGPLGIYLWIFIILTSIASFILAILAIIECKKDKELKGTFLSVATIILSSIVLVLIALTIIFYVLLHNGQPSPVPSSMLQN